MSKADDVRIAAQVSAGEMLGDWLFDALPKEVSEAVLKIAVARLLGRVAAEASNPMIFLAQASELAKEIATLMDLRKVNEALLRHREPKGRA